MTNDLLENTIATVAELEAFKDRLSWWPNAAALVDVQLRMYADDDGARFYVEAADLRPLVEAAIKLERARLGKLVE